MDEDLGIIQDSCWASDTPELLVLFTNGYRIYELTEGSVLMLDTTVEQQGIKGVGYVNGEWRIVVQDASGLTIFNAVDHKASLNLDAPPQNVTWAEWSPDGKWLACGADDFRFALWCAEKGKKMFEHEIRWAPLDPFFAQESSEFERLSWSADSMRFSLLPKSIFYRQVFVVNAASGDVVEV